MVVAVNKDYLDAAGKKANWLTGRPYSSEYKKSAKWWSKLPVYKNVTQFVPRLRGTQVNIVIAGTGSGKTVIIPKVALKFAKESPKSSSDDFEGRGGAVVVTNPKSSITEINAKTAAQTLDVEIGEEVGYAFRDAPPGASSQDNSLLFVTDGNLVGQARRDPLFRRYSVVVIDEVHERTQYIDTLIYMLRRAALMRPELRVVIISATIDPKPFLTYFENGGLSTSLTDVPGATYYPVKSIYSESSSTPGEYLVSLGLPALRAALVSSPQEGGDNILFFVPTAKDAEKGCTEMLAACKRGILPPSCDRTRCATLYSKMPKAKQQVALSTEIVLPDERKVIFATNIAESSLTLSGLSVVIDSGLELDSTWVPEYHGARLEKSMSSQAQMRQRKGRVGRNAPGTCYHLYSQKEMEARPEYPAPEIATIDVTDDLLVTLQAHGTLSAACRVFASYITPPSALQVMSALSVLSLYGMVRLFPATATATRADVAALHYSEIDFMKEVDAMPAGATAGNVSGVFEGQLTSLGHLTIQIKLRTRLDFWNALLVLCGRVFEGEMQRMIIIASFLDVTGGDLTSVWFEEGDRPKKMEAFMGALQRRTHELAKTTLTSSDDWDSSEHLAIVALYEEISDDKTPHASVLNQNVVDKVKRRVALMEKDMSRFEIRRIRSLVAETPSLMTTYSSTGLTNFERCIVCSRMYHAAGVSSSTSAKEKEQGNKGFNRFLTRTTLKPLTSTPEPTFKFPQKRQHAVKRDVAIYEYAAIQPGKTNATTKIVTYLPHRVFKNISI